jgi:hypothetical protein
MLPIYLMDLEPYMHNDRSSAGVAAGSSSCTVQQTMTFAYPHETARSYRLHEPRDLTISEQLNAHGADVKHN